MIRIANFFASTLRRISLRLIPALIIEYRRSRQSVIEKPLWLLGPI